MQCPYCGSDQHHPIGLVLDNNLLDPLARQVDGSFAVCDDCEAMFEVPSFQRRSAHSHDRVWRPLQDVTATVWPDAYTNL